MDPSCALFLRGYGCGAAEERGETPSGTGGKTGQLPLVTWGRGGAWVSGWVREGGRGRPGAAQHGAFRPPRFLGPAPCLHFACAEAQVAAPSAGAGTAALPPPPSPHRGATSIHLPRKEKKKKKKYCHRGLSHRGAGAGEAGGRGEAAGARPGRRRHLVGEGAGWRATAAAPQPQPRDPARPRGSVAAVPVLLCLS